jgi:hypothetical protein
MFRIPLLVARIASRRVRNHAAPVAPVAPVAAVAPVAPGSPVAPVAPLAPVAPVRPLATPLLVPDDAEIDAQLDAACAEILALAASGRALPEVDEAVAYACARAEEWTA